MSGFSWNIRGLNKSSKHMVIKRWLVDAQLSFGCLLETRVKETKAQTLSAKLFPGWSLLTNYEYNSRGRIWILWRDNVCMTPFFKSSQLVTCSVKLEDHDEEFFCSFIYASNFMEDRRNLWSDLRDHYDSPIFRNKPWILFGDFNETLDMAEHSRVDMSPLITLGMRNFQDLVNYCSLSDLGYHGPLFTWCNKRDNDLIMKKLDRVLVSDCWFQTFPHAYTVFETGGCSDHLRSRTSFKVHSSPTTRRKPFKFVNVVVEMEEFLPLVTSHWAESTPIFLSTSSLFRFSKKLKTLKSGLRHLAKNKVGNLVKKSKEAYEFLCTRQKINTETPSAQAMVDEKLAYDRWENLAGLEEKFLKQKSKLHWLQVGDKNNKTFHNAVVARKSQNTIREILCSDGRVASQEEDIQFEAEKYFRELLQFEPPQLENISLETLQSLLNYRCSEEDRAGLTATVSGMEITKVLFSMPNDKSPGPDGYTSEFFKASWTVVGGEFITAVQSFFQKGFLPKGINSTILALLKKKTEAKEMKDYRPISLCNVIYKVITKIIANRMKRILPKFISGNQSAFIEDRLLIENLLLATELVKDYHKESVSTRCAIKIDISKAFDSVQWSFLLKTLEALGFPAEYIHWINLCITTASFSVQVNGELVGFFNSKRGLRQGCPLSPYLFVICMDVLSKLLDRAAGAREFGYHPRCKTIGLTHLSFADDIIILTDGKVRSVEGIVKVFDEFGDWSGLRISLEKSTTYFAGVSQVVQHEVQNRFNFASGTLPVRYLGLPLVTKCLNASDYSPLLEHLRRRISSWTTRFLSFAGRLNLISSVLWSITNFWMGAFCLPKMCIDEINKLCSSFLWSGPGLTNKSAKVAWHDVCKPKSEGGLGLRSLKEVNKVSVLKLIWRIVSHSPSLWVKWIKTNLIKQGSFWAIRESTTLGSWMWKKILKARAVAKSFCKVKIGTGAATSFWFDNWSEMGCLMDLLGPRGIIDLGIGRYSSVAEACVLRRRRGHRQQILNDVEEIIHMHQITNQGNVADIVLWKGKEDKFKPQFSTKDTWVHIRPTSQGVTWLKGIWFSHSSPKFSFCAWLAVLNRLSTGDRMISWNTGASGLCEFCPNSLETRDHLFFTCRYTSGLWTAIAKGIFGNHFSTNWLTILGYISNPHLGYTRNFLVRYVFQASIYTIWRERNARRHGEQHHRYDILVRWIDKQVRNQLSAIKAQGDTRLSEGMQLWFASRS